MADHDIAGAADKHKFRYYFIRPDYNTAERPPALELRASGRTKRRLAKRHWEIEHGGRFHTWVYVAGLVAMLLLFYLIIFGF